MNKYETIIIINGSLTEKQKKETIKNIKEFISKNGKIIKLEDIGLKKLAYEIQKQSKGYYIVIEFEAKPNTIVQLERTYRITEAIIKFMTIRIEE